MYSRIFELHAQLLKALAHPRRLEIIHLLRDQEMYVSDIYEMLDLPQANISQHLMILRDAGIVKTHRQGKQVKYTIAHPNTMTACDLLREVLIDQHQDSELSNALTFTMKDLVPLTHDPVCKMRVSPKTAGDGVIYHDQEYFFCASGCRKKFTKNPHYYV